MEPDIRKAPRDTVSIPRQRSWEDAYCSAQFGRALYVRTGWEPDKWVQNAVDKTVSPVYGYDRIALALKEMQVDWSRTQQPSEVARGYHLPSQHLGLASPFLSAEAQVLQILGFLDERPA